MGRWFVAGACLLGAAIAAPSSPVVVAERAQGRAASQASGTTEGEEDPGVALTRRTCKDECHTEDRITETRRAAFEWARLVVDMEARGARATEDEFAVIQRYLQRNFGFVNVNRASAADMRVVLGLESSAASAIVEYRKSHGPFADVAALAAVPGLDRATLEAQADAIRFN